MAWVEGGGGGGRGGGGRGEGRGRGWGREGGRRGKSRWREEEEEEEGGNRRGGGIGGSGGVWKMCREGRAGEKGVIFMHRIPELHTNVSIVVLMWADPQIFALSLSHLRSIRIVAHLIGGSDSALRGGSRPGEQPVLSLFLHSHFSGRVKTNWAKENNVGVLV